MIKINGPNYPQGNGDYYIFGNLKYGDGNGKGIRFNYFNNFFGNGWGDGESFGDKFGDGESGSSHPLKEEFQKYD